MNIAIVGFSFLIWKHAAQFNSKGFFIRGVSSRFEPLGSKSLELNQVFIIFTIFFQKCLILWLGGSSENQFPTQLSFGNQLRYQNFRNFIQGTSASCLQPAIIRSSESLFSWCSTRCKKVTLKLIKYLYWPFYGLP